VKKLIVAVFLLICSTANAETIKIDDSTTLDTTTMFICERTGLYHVGGNNPIIGGRIAEGNKQIKFVVDTELTKIGLISEIVFNSWGDIESFTDYTKSADSINVNVSAAASNGRVTTVASANARVHSYRVNWQRPDKGTALEKYYLAAMAQYENNKWEIANQSKQHGFIEVK